MAGAEIAIPISVKFQTVPSAIRGPDNAASAKKGMFSSQVDKTKFASHVVIYLPTASRAARIMAKMYVTNVMNKSHVWSLMACA